MDISIDSIRDRDRARRVELGRRAFGGVAVHDPDAPDFPADQVVAAYHGDDLIGSVSTHSFGMHWGGRAVPCGGVSGVSVAPEARGRDVARGMLRESFDRMIDRGQVISALYPTTATLYRSTGFEFAGWWRRSSFPIGELVSDRGSADIVWAPVAFDDPAIPSTYASMAAAHDGWLAIPDLDWEYRAHVRARDGGNRFAYAARRDGEPVASLVLSYAPPSDPSKMFDLEIDHLAAADADALASAMGTIARHGTTAGAVSTTLPPEVLAPHVPHLQRLVTTKQWAWMLRLTDVAGAIAQRGWPTSVSGMVSFDVDDPMLPANAGPATFTIANGAAAWERGGPGTVKVSIQQLAAIYAGCNPRSLAAGGHLEAATGDDLDLLRAAFAANPSAIDFF